MKKYLTIVIITLLMLVSTALAQPNNWYVNFGFTCEDLTYYRNVQCEEDGFTTLFGHIFEYRARSPMYTYYLKDGQVRVISWLTIGSGRVGAEMYAYLGEPDSCRASVCEWTRYEEALYWLVDDFIYYEIDWTLLE